MGATRLDAKKHFCPYACMRIASESQQNRPVFEADGDWQWKMGHLRQREAQTVVLEKRWGCPDGGQAWIDGQEGSSVCLVGLAGNHPLWAAPLWPNAQFGPVLPTTGLMQKRPSLINRGRIIFHQDNAWPHTSLVTLLKLRELGWEVLLHPPYSPDLTPSDYYLFMSMANELGSRKLATRESCENLLSEFFDNREASFYKRGIMKLASRWEVVIEQNGAYLTKIALL